MPKLPDLLVSAVTTFDGKALGKGEKQISAFGKTVQSLGKTFAATFSAAAMLSYGKNAVNAFAQNEKSAKRLEMVLKNIGLGFDTATIEKNLGDISAKFGYEGEVLRESFQKLITVTGDTAKAQDLLNLSLDVAAGSGEDLLTVNQDLAAALVGNTKGLKKYNLGLTQSELATLDFNDAVALLTKTFAGAGEAELTTYTGKMRVLKEAAESAKEEIGRGLVSAITSLAGSEDSLDPLIKKMNDLSVATGDFIALLFGGKTKDGYSLKDAIDIVFSGGVKGFGNRSLSASNQDTQRADAAAAAKAAAEAAKREKERLALLRKQALAEKNKLSLSKAAAVFDTNRISIAAALRATYDKETIIRLEALQAIEEDNGELALKKINELAAFQKNADLQKLAGITTIGDAALQELNNRLLNELRVINSSKMAEEDKELAREEAFKKYNAALTAAGGLAEKNSYDERTQIQLTEVARLASLSKTYNASLTLDKIRESEEINMIDRVAKAQKAADDARLKALQEYINLLGKVGTGGSAGGGGGGGGGAGNSTVATYASVAAKEAADAVKYFNESVNDTFQTVEDSGAFNALVKSFMGGAIGSFNAGDFRATEGGTTFNSGSVGAFDRDINIKIETGIGDPEAIARAVEDVLNQSSYRGTSVNRGSGVYIA